MTEDFLHYLWKYRIIGHSHTLSAGEPCLIEHPGYQNKDSGPDFFNARIRIHETVWAGNVEIHILASDWIRHRHQNDPAYDNVILHVVYQADVPIFLKNGDPVPTLILKNNLNHKLFSVYQGMMLNQQWIPCVKLLTECSPLTWHSWIDRLVIERLDRKVCIVMDRLKIYGNDWNTVFYQLLSKNFGTHVNALPMELLARSLPLSVLRKHSKNPEQLEALFFGQAALLDSRYRNPYVVHLRKEYAFLSHKYQLKPITGHLWKFLRMRPSNFPTIRIAQLCQLIHHHVDLFSFILELDTLSEFESIFSVSASDFWNTHYSFTSKSADRPKKIGRQMAHLILINTIIPVLYLYGKLKGTPAIRTKAYRLLQQLHTENNAVVRRWKEEGLSVESAYQSQGLLELYRRYCLRKRCLSCAVGNAILARVR
jgi:hypothetical protein